MSRFLKVDCCNECPYHEQMWTGEYARTERIYFCAQSKTQFLIPNEGKFTIHPDCGLQDYQNYGFLAELNKYELDVVVRAYA